MMRTWAPTGLQLALAAAAAMAGWEIFAKGIAPLIMGGPLSPNGLIVSLIKSLVGVKPPGYVATMLHWFTGLVGYPLGFLVLATALPRIGVVGQGIIVGVGTWFLALGVFAPLAGLPFMLKFATITWVSLWGHLAYGLILAALFSAQRGASASSAAKPAVGQA